MPQRLPQAFDIFAHAGFHHVYYNYRGKPRETFIAVYRQAVVIYNPRAGKLKRGAEPFVARLIKTLDEEGHGARAVATTGPKTAAALARRAIEEGAELILAAGGDGTLNEIAQAVAYSTVPLGLLPTGTANVLANELGIDLQAERVARAISGFVPRRIAIGRIHYTNGAAGSRYFLLMAGVGLDAHIVYQLNAGLKARFGKVAYWMTAFRALGRPVAEFQVEIDGQRHACGFALASRVRNYGGDFWIAREGNLLSDDFSVVLFGGRQSYRYLKYLAGVVTNRLTGMKGVSVLRARQIRFSAPEDSRVYMQVDGEYAGHLPGSVEIVPDALTLLIPRSYCHLR